MQISSNVRVGLISLFSILLTTPLTITSRQAPASAQSASLTLHTLILPDNLSSGATHPDTDLRDQINALKSPLFDSRIDGDCPKSSDNCKAGSAAIFIRLHKSVDGGFDFKSFDAADGSTIFTIHKIPDKGNKINFSQSDLDSLLGSVVGGVNSLSLAHGYHQFIQLVPDFQNSNDNDYSIVLRQELARRGIASIKSSYTSATLSGDSNPTVCSRGDKYLVYSVSVDAASQWPYRLFGASRVKASTTGYLFDCTDTNATLAMTGHNDRLVPTTNSTLTGIGAVMLSLFSKFGTRFTLTTAAISNFIDADPSSINQRNPVAEKSVRDFVNNFCIGIKSRLITQQTNQSGSSANEMATSGQFGKDLTSTSSGRAGSNIALNPNDFLGQNPYRVQCDPPLRQEQQSTPNYKVSNDHF